MLESTQGKSHIHLRPYRLETEATGPAGYGQKEMVTKRNPEKKKKKSKDLDTKRPSCLSLRLPLRDLKRIGNSVPRNNRSLQQRSRYKEEQQALLCSPEGEKEVLGELWKKSSSARERSAGVGVVGKAQHLQHWRDILVKKVGGRECGYIIDWRGAHSLLIGRISSIK